MPPLLNRETAILAFNRRVLEQARREDVPLLERLRYVCIVSSNLDEFFEVRFADTLEASRRPDTGVTAADIEALSAAAHALVDDKYKVFNDEVMPALAANGIRIVNHADRNEAERRWVEHFFETRGPAAAGAGRARSGASVPAGREQVAQLHRPARRQGRLRPAQHDLHRQGAAGAAAGDQAAGRGPGAGLRPADERHPRPPGRALPRPRGRVVLAVPHHPRLRPRGRCRRQQPAPGAALGPHDAPLRPGGAARGRQHLPGRALELPPRAVQPARIGALQGQRAGQPGAHERPDRPGRCAAASLRAVHPGLAGEPAAAAVDVRPDPQLRPDAAPAFRVVRAGGAVHARGRRRPVGAGDQADDLPRRQRVAADGPADRGGAARQGSDGRGGAAGPLRRGGQHQLGRAARGGGRAGRVRRRRPQDPRQAAAGDAARGRAAAPLRPPLHRQLQPATPPGSIPTSAISPPTRS